MGLSEGYNADLNLVSNSKKFVMRSIMAAHDNAVELPLLLLLHFRQVKAVCSVGLKSLKGFTAKAACR